MKRHEIDPGQFVVSAHDLWNKQWLLLTSGDFSTGHYNTMTVGWGSFGTMWNRPFAQVVVRPTRYTFEFMNQYDSFTLCAFDNAYKKALNMLGSKSGRHGDKISESGVTPIASRMIKAPGFEQATLIVECRKIYWQDFDPTHFLDDAIEGFYPDRDYHRVYFGEIVYLQGIDDFTK